MKKLILVGLGLASGAMTVGAQAQSSVTIFGIVDGMVQHGSGSIGSRTRVASGGINSSRLGFRGTEDLGGGLSASFWLEAGYSVDDGLGLGTNTNNQASGNAIAGLNGGQGLTFGRRSTVALAHKSWGELRLGRDYVPTYWNVLYSDVFGNLASGHSLMNQASIIGVTAVRVANSVSYLSPNIAGFSLQATHYRGENASNVPASDDGTGNSIRIGYSAKPFAFGLAMGRTEYLAGDARPLNAFAEYDFGVVRVVAGAARDKLGTLRGRSYALGAVAPVGPGEFKVSYSSYETSALGNPKSTKIAVGYVHHLSKRTAAYTTFGRIRNSGGAALAQNGATTAPNTSSNGYEFGIRHAF